MSNCTTYRSLLAVIFIIATQSPTLADDPHPASTAGDPREIALPARGARVVLQDPLSRSLIGTLTPPSSEMPQRTPIGRGWRHEFDRVLTHDGAQRIVFDADGVQRTFVRSEEGARRFEAVETADGVLLRVGDRYRWRRADGRVVNFEGSIPVSIEASDGSRIDLDHRDGHLVRARGGDGSVRHYRYREGRLVRVVDERGNRLDLALAEDGTLRLRAVPVTQPSAPESNPRPMYSQLTNLRSTNPRSTSPRPTNPPFANLAQPDTEAHECQPDTAASETPCDTDLHPPPIGFGEPSDIPFAVRVDARPGSCRSYFEDYAGTARGAAIEDGLGAQRHYAAYESTVWSFPVIDFIGAELRVVRSRDLALPSYNGSRPASGASLFDRLIRDGEDVHRYFLDPLARDGQLSVTEQGRTTSLSSGSNRPLVLEMVVRHGMASSAQIEQILRARIALRERFDIELRVIEIP